MTRQPERNAQTVPFPAGDPSLHDLFQAVGAVIRGKDEVVRDAVVTLLAGGHLLIEDIPGVGKTTLAKALSRSISTDCHRIQFTPDLLPADITGGMIYSPKNGEFTFRAGPIFCHILLADEVNRASPRTQSALLEAMSERRKLPLPNLGWSHNFRQWYIP